MKTKTYAADVIIAGGGLAGIATALELLEANKKIIIFDRDHNENFGGLAKESFGGIFLVDTPHQRRLGIKDNSDIALRDWISYGELDNRDSLPVKWAEQYVNLCKDEVYVWLRNHSIRFFPVVHWVERGLHQPGNSVPRFHMVWGTGFWLISALVSALYRHRNAKNLKIQFRHHIKKILTDKNRVIGISGTDEETDEDFSAQADQVVIASGGISGSIERVKKNWFTSWGDPPEIILNGSHRFADGELHDAAMNVDANITHTKNMWLYAAGVHHPNPDRPFHGLSLVPPKSALWVNYRGERIGPQPLISGYDTRFLVEQICRQDKKYSWQVMNWKIAIKELAVSGSEHNRAIRDKKIFEFIKTMLLGNKKLVNYFIEECKDFIVADSVEELAGKMNLLAESGDVQTNVLYSEIESYDTDIARGEKHFRDDQLRRIAHLRKYRGDRVRTCKFQKILDKNAMPLIAIREFILSRKSLGGIQTDLECRVLKPPVNGEQKVIDGLYAVGESAGFGGGGIHGVRSLEGTFLGSCILTGRIAGKSIAGEKI